MELTLRPGEVQLLQQILTEHLSNLRMEIANTENFSWRETMKAQEASIKRIIAELERLQALEERSA